MKSKRKEIKYCDRCGKLLSRQEKKYIHSITLKFIERRRMHECRSCWKIYEAKALVEMFDGL
jgi:hypothetical protein